MKSDKTKLNTNHRICIALIARNKRMLNETLLCLAREVETRGQRINQGKTIFHMLKKTDNRIKLIIREYIFQEVKYFTYLGVMINGKNERGPEIRERIKAVNIRATRSTYYRLLKDKSVRKQLK